MTDLYNFLKKVWKFPLSYSSTNNLFLTERGISIWKLAIPIIIACSVIVCTCPPQNPVKLFGLGLNLHLKPLLKVKFPKISPSFSKKCLIWCTNESFFQCISILLMPRSISQLLSRSAFPWRSTCNSGVPWDMIPQKWSAWWKGLKWKCCLIMKLGSLSL